MGKRSEGQARGKYTLEYKLEAVRLVKGGQAASVTAKVLGIPNQTLDNWVRLSNKGQLKGAGDKSVSPEQMELARLRAENSRLRMERDILKKRRRTSRGNCCEVRSGIAKHKAHWSITLACQVLGVSPSGYFEHWRCKDTDKPSKQGVSKRISDEALLVHILAIHTEVKQEYGWPKMWKELVARGMRAVCAWAKSE